jgi:hypothetical protein
MPRSLVVLAVVVMAGTAHAQMSESFAGWQGGHTAVIVRETYAQVHSSQYFSLDDQSARHVLRRAPKPLDLGIPIRVDDGDTPKDTPAFPRLALRVTQDPGQAKALEDALDRAADGEPGTRFPTVQTTLELDLMAAPAATPQPIWRRSERRGVVAGETGYHFPEIRARRARRSPDRTRVLVELVLGAGDETDFIVASLPGAR